MVLLRRIKQLTCAGMVALMLSTGLAGALAATASAADYSAGVARVVHQGFEKQVSKRAHLYLRGAKVKVTKVSAIKVGNGRYKCLVTYKFDFKRTHQTWTAMVNAWVSGHQVMWQADSSGAVRVG